MAPTNKTSHSNTIRMTPPPTTIKPKKVQGHHHLPRAERRRPKHELRKQTRRAQKQKNRANSRRDAAREERREGSAGQENEPLISHRPCEREARTESREEARSQTQDTDAERKSQTHDNNAEGRWQTQNTVRRERTSMASSDNRQQEKTPTSPPIEAPTIAPKHNKRQPKHHEDPFTDGSELADISRLDESTYNTLPTQRDHVFDVPQQNEEDSNSVLSISGTSRELSPLCPNAGCRCVIEFSTDANEDEEPSEQVLDEPLTLSPTMNTIPRRLLPSVRKADAHRRTREDSSTIISVSKTRVKPTSSKRKLSKRTSSKSTSSERKRAKRNTRRPISVPRLIDPNTHGNTYIIPEDEDEDEEEAQEEDEIQMQIPTQPNSTLDHLFNLYTSTNPHARHPNTLAPESTVRTNSTAPPTPDANNNDFNNGDDRNNTPTPPFFLPESFFADNDDDIASIAPPDSPAYNFIQGLRDEQSYLHSRSHTLTASITQLKRKIFGPDTADLERLRVLEEMRTAAEGLCFDLFIAEYALRDVLSHPREEEEGRRDLDAAVRGAMNVVGECVGRYGLEMERLGGDTLEQS
ncbi:hypothetical protein BKA63DRAFT_48690 [Paraphoma chrysanthemicola]|nr:hypothetical protein BKA63DRAFT_48690 [Paraphoma chrysanthemicola]